MRTTIFISVCIVSLLIVYFGFWKSIKKPMKSEEDINAGPFFLSSIIMIAFVYTIKYTIGF